MKKSSYYLFRVSQGIWDVVVSIVVAGLLLGYTLVVSYMFVQVTVQAPNLHTLLISNSNSNLTSYIPNKPSTANNMNVDETRSNLFIH